MLTIRLTSVPVDDQAKGLAFYTEKLGFEPRLDIPMGEYRWLTVGAPGHNEVELALEPAANDLTRDFQQGLFDAGIPFTAFATDDIHADYKALSEKGVVFRGEPKDAGGVLVATLEDTCGNLIQLYQEPA